MPNKHERESGGNRHSQSSRDRQGREKFGSRGGQSRTGSEWREMGRQGEDPRFDPGQGARDRYRGRERQDSGHFPMDDLAYDIVTVLHEKSKGLEAFDRYLQDARGDDVEDLLEEIREQDERAIEELQDHLHRLLSGNGRHRRAA